MEDQLWNLFRETGDPMSYLLYRAEKKRKETDAKKTEPQPKNGPPQASA